MRVKSQTTFAIHSHAVEMQVKMLFATYLHSITDMFTDLQLQLLCLHL